MHIPCPSLRGLDVDVIFTRKECHYVGMREVQDVLSAVTPLPLRVSPSCATSCAHQRGCRCFVFFLVQSDSNASILFGMIFVWLPRMNNLEGQQHICFPIFCFNPLITCPHDHEKMKSICRMINCRWFSVRFSSVGEREGFENEIGTQ